MSKPVSSQLFESICIVFLAACVFVACDESIADPSPTTTTQEGRGNPSSGDKGGGKDKGGPKGNPDSKDKGAPGNNDKNDSNSPNAEPTREDLRDIRSPTDKEIQDLADETGAPESEIRETLKILEELRQQQHDAGRSGNDHNYTGVADPVKSISTEINPSDIGPSLADPYGGSPTPSREGVLDHSGIDVRSSSTNSRNPGRLRHVPSRREIEAWHRAYQAELSREEAVLDNIEGNNATATSRLGNTRESVDARLSSSRDDRSQLVRRSRRGLITPRPFRTAVTRHFESTDPFSPAQVDRRIQSWAPSLVFQDLLEQLVQEYYEPLSPDTQADLDLQNAHLLQQLSVDLHRELRIVHEIQQLLQNDDLSHAMESATEVLGAIYEDVSSGLQGVSGAVNLASLDETRIDTLDELYGQAAYATLSAILAAAEFAKQRGDDPHWQNNIQAIQEQIKASLDALLDGALLDAAVYAAIAKVHSLQYSNMQAITDIDWRGEIVLGIATLGTDIAGRTIRAFGKTMPRHILGSIGRGAAHLATTRGWRTTGKTLMRALPGLGTATKRTMLEAAMNGDERSIRGLIRSIDDLGPRAVEKALKPYGPMETQVVLRSIESGHMSGIDLQMNLHKVAQLRLPGATLVESYNQHLAKGVLPRKVAATFLGMGYTKTRPAAGTIFYRIGNPDKSYWSRTPPASDVQAMSDLAWHPAFSEYKNVDIVSEVTVPNGVKWEVYEGITAPQTGTDFFAGSQLSGYFSGGTYQTVIPEHILESPAFKKATRSYPFR